MNLIINKTEAYHDNVAAGLHVLRPTFIEFMVALDRAMDNELESLYIYDDQGQFAIMAIWALKEKIHELTGLTVEISRV